MKKEPRPHAAKGWGDITRKAGIGYHKIVASHTTPSEIRALVEKLVPAG
ncbi:hypothetical protein [Erythrobacter sp. SAORIC-644]|nr:hypothetical protein [Erythrobacter sp. SAORIC-644]